MRMFGERFCNQRDLHINSNSTINQELNMFFKRLSSSVMGVIDVVDNHKKNDTIFERRKNDNRRTGKAVRLEGK